MQTHLDLEAGTFYALGQGHIIVTSPVPAGTFELGIKFALNSMFEMWELTRNNVAVGYYFYSGFNVENKGGFIITYLDSKRGKATACTLLIRRPEFMVYDYPSCGALVISTKVNPRIHSILLEQ